MFEDSTPKLPVPLPIGWTLQMWITCPGCGYPMHWMYYGVDIIDGIEWTRKLRDLYCVTENCPHFNILYSLEISSAGVIVRETAKMEVT